MGSDTATLDITATTSDGVPRAEGTLTVTSTSASFTCTHKSFLRHPKKLTFSIALTQAVPPRTAESDGIIPEAAARFWELKYGYGWINEDELDDGYLKAAIVLHANNFAERRWGLSYGQYQYRLYDENSRKQTSRTPNEEPK